jgi:hypothetical protein
MERFICGVVSSMKDAPRTPAPGGGRGVKAEKERQIQTFDARAEIEVGSAGPGGLARAYYALKAANRPKQTARIQSAP